MFTDIERFKNKFIGVYELHKLIFLKIVYDYAYQKIIYEL